MNDYWKVAILLAMVVATTNAVLTLTVYYQADNHEFKRFITKQLLPTYASLNAYGSQTLNVKLVPYGHSFKQSQMENGTWVITCNQNAYECYHNKIHACATDRYKTDTGDDYWKPLNYINCLVNTNNYDSPDYCALKTCFADNEMPNCVNTVDGDALIVQHGIETAALGFHDTVSFPIVTFNGKYMEHEQKWAREHLLSLACNKTTIGHTAPPVCSLPRAKTIMTHNNFGTGSSYPVMISCYP